MRNSLKLEGQGKCEGRDGTITSTQKSRKKRLLLPRKFRSLICINKYGNKWVEIAKNLSGRTENWVKNLYYATLRRYVRNINKFKTVQTEMNWLEGIEINEKMLAELFLIEHIDFKIFQ